MKLHTLIMSLLIGAGMMTTAVAGPDEDPYWRHDQDRGGPVGTYQNSPWDSSRGWVPDYALPHRPHVRFMRTPPRWDQHWVTLVAPVPTVRDRQNIHVGRNLGRFSQLRFDMIRGDAYVQQLAIEYIDGSTQVVPIARRISEGDPGLVIPLQGVRDRAINRVIVYTDPRSRGAYQLLGN